MMGTLGQENATATAASTGPRVSSACQADMAPAAGVCLSFLYMLLLTSHLNYFVRDGLSKPRNASPFEHQHFPQSAPYRGMTQGLVREERKAEGEQRLLLSL